MGVARHLRCTDIGSSANEIFWYQPRSTTGRLHHRARSAARALPDLFHNSDFGVGDFRTLDKSAIRHRIILRCDVVLPHIDRDVSLFLARAISYRTQFHWRMFGNGHLLSVISRAAILVDRARYRRFVSSAVLLFRSAQA